MPEISRFFGIIIRMFVEAETASYASLPRVLSGPCGNLRYRQDRALAGSLPRRQERLVLAWAELHQEELMSNWQTLQQGRPPIKIEPLR
jgi:hypothetical protein